MKLTRRGFVQGAGAAASLWWGGVAFAAPMRRQRNYLDMTWWDPYVENITDVDTYLRRKFRQDVTDKATGVGVEALKNILAEIVAFGRASGESWRITKIGGGRTPELVGDGPRRTRVLQGFPRFQPSE